MALSPCFYCVYQVRYSIKIWLDTWRHSTAISLRKYFLNSQFLDLTSCLKTTVCRISKAEAENLCSSISWLRETWKTTVNWCSFASSLLSSSSPSSSSIVNSAAEHCYAHSMSPTNPLTSRLWKANFWNLCFLQAGCHFHQMVWIQVFNTVLHSSEPALAVPATLTLLTSNLEEVSPALQLWQSMQATWPSYCRSLLFSSGFHDSGLLKAFTHRTRFASKPAIKFTNNY